MLLGSVSHLIDNFNMNSDKSFVLEASISFSGVVDCLNPNGADQYAMLMGCHELRALGGL